MDWAWLGRVPFPATAAMQERLRDEVLAGRRDEALLLCEHEPVVSLGRRAKPDHVLLTGPELRARGIAVHHASRGGDVTYHGPGQLVAYPIFRLRRGVLAHVQGMAQSVLTVLTALGIAGQWRREQPGVWVGANKICAFGVHVRHRIAIHGLALNVTTEVAEGFAAIVPCGLREGGVTSIAALAPTRPAPALPALASELAAAFAQVFDTAPVAVSPARFEPLPDCKTESAVARISSA